VQALIDDIDDGVNAVPANRRQPEAPKGPQPPPKRQPANR
jgi:hypothetical protein